MERMKGRGRSRKEKKGKRGRDKMRLMTTAVSREEKKRRKTSMAKLEQYGDDAKVEDINQTFNGLMSLPFTLQNIAHCILDTGNKSSTSESVKQFPKLLPSVAKGFFVISSRYLEAK